MSHVTYAPDLVEEAVLLAERAAPEDEARIFRRERDRIYDVPDVDERERLFRALHVRWFAAFDLDRGVAQTVRDHEWILHRVAACHVLRAITGREEGGDLIDPSPTACEIDSKPTLVLRLRPTTLVNPEATRALLVHELMHVADMLDPQFGYQRTLPPSDDGPSAGNLLRDRYRVLWDATIDGRLVRAGAIDPRARAARWREFAATFVMLGDRRQDAFDAWFDQVQPTHQAMVAFALAPDAARAGSDGRCPLCRFPVAALDARPGRLSAAARATIRADRPEWGIEQGLCSQCLDMYEARSDETTNTESRHANLEARSGSRAADV